MRLTTDSHRSERVNAPGSGRSGDLRRAVLLLSGLGVAYAVSIALLGVGGGSPGITPWIAIPRESYFLVESTFVTPVIVAGALLAASTTYLLARALGSAGGFDDTLVGIARATCVATLFSLIPDFLMGLTTTAGLLDGATLAADLVRPSPWRTFLWIYLGLYTLAFLLLYPSAVRAAHPSLRTGAAIGIGWSGFVTYQTVLLIFIR